MENILSKVFILISVVLMTVRGQQLSYRPLGTVRVEVPAESLINRVLLLSLRNDTTVATNRDDIKVKVIKNDAIESDIFTKVVFNTDDRSLEINDDGERRVLMVPIDKIKSPSYGDGGRGDALSHGRVPSTLKDILKKQNFPQFESKDHSKKVVDKTKGGMVEEEFLVLMVNEGDSSVESELEALSEDLDFDQSSEDEGLQNIIFNQGTTQSNHVESVKRRIQQTIVKLQASLENLMRQQSASGNVVPGRPLDATRPTYGVSSVTTTTPTPQSIGVPLPIPPIETTSPTITAAPNVSLYKDVVGTSQPTLPASGVALPTLTSGGIATAGQPTAGVAIPGRIPTTSAAGGHTC